ncbi:histidinol phosphate phosphatase [Desulfosarcina widdelii]|uniref:D,D-heptose 1,7-bisphosphate phosphatase n=1 Tax=Desulfosarcina widdelii TaxID=947919 RepID=A0A5K7ZG61_9BACT|nr:D-glycero-beta-D-manno-heptose 1,7-bisphosphate 7-phosphatase [Desulfosarcina widdelii]BBO78771.1 histidinol phosphate phosphatase [Desulfosarcina widdelii]
MPKLLPDITTVFLDRDGVINVDSPDYIKSWQEFRLIPGSLEAIALLTRAGIAVIVITNQSAVNRGMMSPEALETMHRRMCRAVADSGGRITDIFFCPHRPDENCDCRKPKPGMLLAARDRYGIDLASAVMVGDSEKDILTGQAAGCGATVLVKTGNGEMAIQSLARKGAFPDHVANDLAAAANWILDQRHV